MCNIEITCTNIRELHTGGWLASRSGCPLLPEENYFASVLDDYERRSGNYAEETIAMLIP
jgi:hypothetical protein